MITTTTELRIKRVKINTIITACTNEVELQNVAQWNKSAARIAVFGQVKPFTVDGYRFLRTKNPVPTVREALAQYVINLQEGGVLAIASPLVIVNNNQTALFAYVDQMDMGRSWAASSFKDGIPRVFVVSASVLPHIMRDIPESLMFTGDQWENWMHAWLSKYMLKHRYFNADQFGIIVSIPEPVLQPQEPPQKVEEAVVDVPLAEPEAKPVKKQKKAKQPIL